MKSIVLRASSALAASVLVAASILPADAGGAARTRPHSGGSSASPGRASGSASGRGSGAPTRAQGHATYGYYHGGGGYYPYYPYYPYYWDGYYGPWWSVGLWWGWPGYWGDGWWYGYPYHAHPGTTVVYGDDLRLGPAVVAVRVHPGNARMTLDGEALGQAREFDGSLDVLPLDPGRHQFLFESPGYMSLEVNLDAKAGRSYQVAYDLRRGEGRDPRSDAANLPGEPAPEGLPGDRGAPPPTPPGPVGEPERAGLAKGFLKVQVSPRDAAVYLDGEFLGRGDELARLHGAIPVAAGEHRIEVVRPGYRSRAKTVEVGSGSDPAEVRIDLEREGSSTL